MLRIALSLSTAALLLAAVPAAGQPKDGVPLMKPALPATGQAANFRTINWDALVPKDWDPFKDFKGFDFQMLQDGDPRADELLAKMRAAWDNAPANPALVGQAVRIPGFVVPLEEGRDGIREFLLVPYFGACIHSPPPPANQIVHVVPRSPARFRSMDTVWVSGVLTQTRTDSYMGASTYRIEAQAVAPYSSEKR